MNEPQYNPRLTGIQNFKIAFEKGKLEERERFGRIIHDLEDDIFNMSSLGMLSYMNVITRIKQLQKEIGEEKGKC